MKIVYVVHEFPPDYVGGTGVAAFQVAKEMLLRGNRVWVISPRKWEQGLHSISFFDEEVDGLSIRRLVFNGDLSPNPILYEYYNPVMYDPVKQYLKKLSPDIVHIYSLYNLTTSVIDAVKELGVPMALTLTDFWFICPRAQLLRLDGKLCEEAISWQDCVYCLKEKGNLYDRITEVFDIEKMHIRDWNVMPMNINNNKILTTLSAAGRRALFLKRPLRKIYRILRHSPFLSKVLLRRNYFRLLAGAAGRRSFLKNQLGKIDRTICISSFLSKVFLKKNYFHNGFAIISFGTSRSETLPARGGGISNITFGYFGGGWKHKGADILLQAFRQLKVTNAHLKLYGNFPDTEYVEELHRIANGDGRIDFKGPFRRPQITKVLEGIDVLVMPSIWYEAYGLSALEAFVNGVPVIATDIGGIPEIVRDGYNGLLFRRGDALDLKEKMERIINEPGLIQKFRQNIGRLKSIDEECDELSEIYRKLLRK